MAHINNKRDLHIHEWEKKEAIKNAVFLTTGKHLLDAEAEEILTQYKNYLNKDYISIKAFACIQYANKG